MYISVCATKIVLCTDSHCQLELRKSPCASGVKERSTYVLSPKDVHLSANLFRVLLHELIVRTAVRAGHELCEPEDGAR